MLDWSFWFAKKHRGITLLGMICLLVLGISISLLWVVSTLDEKRMMAQNSLVKAKNEALEAESQYRLWQQNKTMLQQGLFYIASNAHQDIKTALKAWQKEVPQRKLRYHVENNQEDTRWHATKVRMVYQVVLGFWAEDEEDLSSIWIDKKKHLPCLTITTDLRLSRAEEAGIDVEEELVCVQF